MRIAAIYDIHGNLPALEAVLREIRAANVDRVFVGGDVLPGPMPRETLDRLLTLEIPTAFIHGNGDLAALAQRATHDPAKATYWGTTSGAPLPEPFLTVTRWSGEQLTLKQAREVARWPKTVTLDVAGIGPVLFCHGTPWSETDGFTRLTLEEKLLPVFAPVQETLVVCGHTHMQFDRTIGKTRVVNAGSVGMPFGEPGADWLLLGPGIQLRHTLYDLKQAAERIRATAYPQAQDFAARNILQPPSEAEMLEVFARWLPSAPSNT